MYLNLILGYSLAISGSIPRNKDLNTYQFTGTFIEVSNRSDPNDLTLGTKAHPVHGAGVYWLTGGLYQGTDLGGAKFAYIFEPGKWLVLYVDPTKLDQRSALVALASAGLTKLAPVMDTRDAEIKVSGVDGNYTVLVNDGKTLKFETAMVAGSDGVHPDRVDNGNPFHPYAFWIKAVDCNSHESKRGFHFTGSAALYNDAVLAKGEF